MKQKNKVIKTKAQDAEKIKFVIKKKRPVLDFSDPYMFQMSHDNDEYFLRESFLITDYTLNDF